MGILDNVTGAIGNLDLSELASKVGLTPEQVEQALSALGQSQAEPGDTAEVASEKSGLPLDKIQALLSQIGGEGVLGKLGGMIGGLGQR